MPIFKSKKPSKNGKIYFFKVYYKDIFNVKKQYCSKLYATKTEAKEAEREFLNNLNKSNNAPVDMTFAELYDKFREFQDDKVRLTTKHNYENKFKYVQDFANLKCKDYNIDHFEAWKKKINSKNLSTRTKNDILKFWKSILNYGMSWYNFDFMQTYRKMTNFNDPNEMKKEMLFYELDEFNQFLASEDDLRFRCLWLTLFYCGLRRGEARGLTWDCVDFKNKKMSITKQVISVSDNSSNWFIGMPKTKDSYRIIPVGDAVLDELKKYKDEVSKARNFNEGFFVFGQEKGVVPFTPSSVLDRKKLIATRAGVKLIRLHDFRHSCASLLINSGANVTMVAKFLGHSKIDETLNTYSHMFQSALDGVMDIINNINK